VRSIPGRDVMCNNATRRCEISSGIEVGSAHGQGANLITHAVAERRPTRTIPASDEVRTDFPDGRKRSTDIQIASDNRDCEDIPVDLRKGKAAIPELISRTGLEDTSDWFAAGGSLVIPLEARCAVDIGLHLPTGRVEGA